MLLAIIFLTWTTRFTDGNFLDPLFQDHYKLPLEKYFNLKNVSLPNRINVSGREINVNTTSNGEETGQLDDLIYSSSLVSKRESEVEPSIETAQPKPTLGHLYKSRILFPVVPREEEKVTTFKPENVVEYLSSRLYREDTERHSSRKGQFTDAGASVFPENGEETERTKHSAYNYDYDGDVDYSDLIYYYDPDAYDEVDQILNFENPNILLSLFSKLENDNPKENLTETENIFINGGQVHLPPSEVRNFEIPGKCCSNFRKKLYNSVNPSSQLEISESSSEIKPDYSNFPSVFFPPLPNAVRMPKFTNPEQNISNNSSSSSNSNSSYSSPENKTTLRNKISNPSRGVLEGRHNHKELGDSLVGSSKVLSPGNIANLSFGHNTLGNINPSKQAFQNSNFIDPQGGVSNEGHTRGSRMFDDSNLKSDELVKKAGMLSRHMEKDDVAISSVNGNQTYLFTKVYQSVIPQGNLPLILNQIILVNAPPKHSGHMNEGSKMKINNNSNLGRFNQRRNEEAFDYPYIRLNSPTTLNNQGNPTTWNERATNVNQEHILYAENSRQTNEKTFDSFETAESTMNLEILPYHNQEIKSNIPKIYNSNKNISQLSSFEPPKVNSTKPKFIESLKNMFPLTNDSFLIIIVENEREENYHTKRKIIKRSASLFPESSNNIKKAKKIILRVNFQDPSNSAKPHETSVIKIPLKPLPMLQPNFKGWQLKDSSSFPNLQSNPLGHHTSDPENDPFALNSAHVRRGFRPSNHNKREIPKRIPMGNVLYEDSEILISELPKYFVNGDLNDPKTLSKLKQLFGENNPYASEVFIVNDSGCKIFKMVENEFLEETCDLDKLDSSLQSSKGFPNFSKSQLPINNLQNEFLAVREGKKEVQEYLRPQYPFPMSPVETNENKKFIPISIQGLPHNVKAVAYTKQFQEPLVSKLLRNNMNTLKEKSYVLNIRNSTNKNTAKSSLKDVITGLKNTDSGNTMHGIRNKDGKNGLKSFHDYNLENSFHPSSSKNIKNNNEPRFHITKVSITSAPLVVRNQSFPQQNFHPGTRRTTNAETFSKSKNSKSLSTKLIAPSLSHSFSRPNKLGGAFRATFSDPSSQDKTTFEEQHHGTENNLGKFIASGSDSLPHVYTGDESHSFLNSELISPPKDGSLMSLIESIGDHHEERMSDAKLTNSGVNLLSSLERIIGKLHGQLPSPPVLNILDSHIISNETGNVISTEQNIRVKSILPEKKNLPQSPPISRKENFADVADIAKSVQKSKNHSFGSLVEGIKFDSEKEINVEFLLNPDHNIVHSSDSQEPTEESFISPQSSKRPTQKDLPSSPPRKTSEEGVPTPQITKVSSKELFQSSQTPTLFEENFSSPEALRILSGQSSLIPNTQRTLSHESLHLPQTSRTLNEENFHSFQTPKMLSDESKHLPQTSRIITEETSIPLHTLKSTKKLEKKSIEEIETKDEPLKKQSKDTQTETTENGMKIIMGGMNITLSNDLKEGKAISNLMRNLTKDVSLTFLGNGIYNLDIKNFDYKELPVDLNGFSSNSSLPNSGDNNTSDVSVTLVAPTNTSLTKDDIKIVYDSKVNENVSHTNVADLIFKNETLSKQLIELLISNEMNSSRNFNKSNTEIPSMSEVREESSTKAISNNVTTKQLEDNEPISVLISVSNDTETHSKNSSETTLESSEENVKEEVKDVDNKDEIVISKITKRPPINLVKERQRVPDTSDQTLPVTKNDTNLKEEDTEDGKTNIIVKISINNNNNEPSTPAELDRNESINLDISKSSPPLNNIHLANPGPANSAFNSKIRGNKPFSSNLKSPKSKTEILRAQLTNHGKQIENAQANRQFTRPKPQIISSIMKRLQSTRKDRFENTDNSFSIRNSNFNNRDTIRDDSIRGLLPPLPNTELIPHLEFPFVLPLESENTESFLQREMNSNWIWSGGEGLRKNSRSLADDIEAISGEEGLHAQLKSFTKELSNFMNEPLRAFETPGIKQFPLNVRSSRTIHNHENVDSKLGHEINDWAW